jgi:hypothetical protein
MAEAVELELYWQAETERAYGVKEDTTPDSPLIWLPKSHTILEDADHAELEEVCTFTVDEWLATKEGLV